LPPPLSPWFNYWGKSWKGYNTTQCLQGDLRKTTIVLQLADRSTTVLKGIVEYVMVSIDSWEYPTDFQVLKPKTNFNFYPLIFRIHWLATVDAYISCRARNMTIKNRHLSKELVLYPSTQPSIEHELTLWLEWEEDDEYYHTTTYPIYTLDTITGGWKHDEDDLVDHILRTNLPCPNQFMS